MLRKLNNLLQSWRLRFHLSKARAVARQLREGDVTTDCQQVVEAFDAVLNIAFSSAVETFVGTLERNRNDKRVMSKEEYQQIRPLLKEWARAKGGTIDEQQFEDFRNSLRDFSKRYPNWATSPGGPSLLEWFQDEIWRSHFQQFFEEATQLRSSVRKTLEPIRGRFHTHAETNYSLLDPYEFEEFIGELFRRMGYTVAVTSKTGDYGVDVIARNEQDTLAIQVKKYAGGNNIGNSDVQKLLGAMQMRKIRANKAILLTTSDFTVMAEEQAKETPIELWNGVHLDKMVRKYMTSEMSEQG